MNSEQYIEIAVRLEPYTDEMAEILMVELGELPFNSFVCEEPFLKGYIQKEDYRPSEVKVVLSGMSSMEQMQVNVATFEREQLLSAPEQELLGSVAEGLKHSVPCTACRYCCAGCPTELDIPLLLSDYNDLRVQFSHTPMMRLEALPDDKKPHACLGCGACAQICPQGIDIPGALSELAALYDKYPKWSAICEARNRIAEGK